MVAVSIYSVALIGLYLISPICCFQEAVRDPKFSIFQIIKFQNGPCTGGTRNGTCYTSAECSNAGGTKDGTCADGFGVCCVTILKSGAATSLNQSYIVDTTGSTGQYTICPCSQDVCRIRFDFTAFTLAGPYNQVGTPGALGTQGDVSTTSIDLFYGDAVGDCLTDTFSISSSTGSGTPIICGTNTGQHVIVDTDGSGCSTVNVGIGATTTTTRSLDIMVTQFKCGDEMGGPPGCLQWFTTASGTVSSFNFPSQPATTTVANTVTHLSSQFYTSCIRKPVSTTSICFWPCNILAGIAIANMPATQQGSFGLSVSRNNAIAQAGAGSNCAADFISIPGSSIVIATMALAAGSQGTGDRYCGRTLNADSTAQGNVSVCTNRTPYQIGVNFDENEAWALATAKQNENEGAGAPGGIIGFSLCYQTQ